MVVQRRVERLVDQRTLTTSADTAHTRERTEWDDQVDVLQVVALAPVSLSLALRPVFLRLGMAIDFVC